jgi:GNAT superfamily N-acetyltransferase
MSLRLVEPHTDQEWREARSLVEEYAASLAVDLCFQNFSEELANFEREYGPPSGAFFLAGDDRGWLGCAGLHRFADRVAEMKRLYVRPAARGLGVGRALVEGVLERAKVLGYERLVLDTLPTMAEAQALYGSLGFRETPAYRFNPVAGTVFLSLELR